MGGAVRWPIDCGCGGERLGKERSTFTEGQVGRQRGQR